MGKLTSIVRRFARTTKVWGSHRRIIGSARGIKKVDIITQLDDYSYVDTLPYGLNDFVYKDQSWSHVVNLQDMLFARSFRIPYRIGDTSCKNTKIKSISKQGARITGGKVIDNWIYWMLDKNLPDCYEVEFETTIDSFLTEFQLAFRHHSIVERIRLQVVDNNMLSFDIVRYGHFFNMLKTMPFKFRVGEKHKIKIVVLGNQYAFFVNDRLIMAVNDRTGTSVGGGFVFVLWDKDGLDDMRVQIDKFSIKEIRRHV